MRTFTGTPIAGASVRLVTLNQTTTTNAEGFYNFGNSNAVRPYLGKSGFSLSAIGRGLVLRLAKDAPVSIQIFGLSGKLFHTVVEKPMQAGIHAFPLALSDMPMQLGLIRFRVGESVTWKKFGLQGEFAVLAEGDISLRGTTLAKSSEAPDSLNVTHPNYHGGLYKRNARRITATTGVQNFRMFSSDSAWNVCAPPITFVFTPSTAGVTYYQQVVPNYVETEQEVLREVCQSIWRTPTEVPTNRRYTRYTANINGSVTTGVASTGGSTLNFNPDYINNKPWYEIIGVQVHEAVHSYQPYYNTTGAAGFGEAMPDAIRALTGFFNWRTAGSRCSGGFAATYQAGGRYWLYIEMKHPGFIYNIYKLTSGDISARVQQVTGESLSTLAQECETTGMPPGSG